MKSVSPRFLDALDSAKAISRIELLVERQVVDVVEFTGGSVTLDAQAEVRGRLNLEVVGASNIPTAPGDHPLGPWGPELRAYRGVPNEQVSLGIFPIQSARPRSSSGELSMAIEAFDRAQIVADADFESDGVIAAGTPADEAILTLLWQAWPDVPYDFVPLAVPLPRLEYGAGEGRWSFVWNIAAACGHELFFDGDGVAILRPIPQPSREGDPDTFLVEGPESRLASSIVTDHAGNLIGLDRDFDRADVNNRWKVIPAGEDAELKPGIATDDDPSSLTYYHGPFGKKPAEPYRNQFVLTTTQAEDAAKGLRARNQGFLDQLTLSALVNPALEPGDVAHITRGELGVDEQHILDLLTIPLTADGAMDTSTRAVRRR